MSKQFVSKKHVTSSEGSLDLSFIPKNIFQTFENTQLSEGAYNAINSWRKLNPSWTHHFFTDKDQRNFIKNNFSQQVLWAYDQLIPGAYRADLWRYCILYIKGGLYVDHKLELAKPLDTMLPSNIHFASFQDRPMPRYHKAPFQHYIWQAFLISEPGHPFLKQAIDNIVNNAKIGYYGHDTLAITGPGLLGRSINETLGKPIDTPIFPGHHHETNHDFHILPNPFDEKDAKYPLPALFGHENVLSTFPNYHQERMQKSLQSNQSGKADYPTAWFLNRVYRHGKRLRDPQDLYYNRHLRAFYKSKIRPAFKQGHYTLGKELITNTLRHDPLQPKIWFAWLKYVVMRRARGKA